MSQQIRSQRPPDHQRGLALALSLVLLLALTLLGVTGMQTANMQQRMAGNARDRAVAFQFAEEALREAEDRILSNNIAARVGSVAEAYEPENAPNASNIASCDADGDGNSLNTASVSLSDFKGSDLPDTPPCYFIEVLEADFDGKLQAGGTVGDPVTQSAETFYRITAIGYGTTPDSRVILQSVAAGAGSAP